MRIKSWLPALLLFVAPLCAADGFDAKYRVLQGDLDGDGDVDIYVREQPKIVLIDFDISIPVPLPPRVVPFALIQGPGQTFTLRTNLAGLNLSAGSTSQVYLHSVDVNLDGNVDAVLTGITSAIGGAAQDQIVFASSATGVRNTPTSLKAIDTPLRSFAQQAKGWLQNPSYFEITALNNGWYDIIEGAEFLAWWNADYLGFWGFEINGTPLVGLSEDPYESSVPPASCYWGLFSCRYFGGQWQMLVTAQELTLQIDYSNFNPNARAFAQQIATSVANDDLVAGSGGAGQVATILGNVLGTPVFGGVLTNPEARLPYEVGFPNEWLGDRRLAAVEGLIGTLQALATAPAPPAPTFQTLPGVTVTETRIPTLEKGNMPDVNAVVLHRTAGSTLNGALTGARSSQTGTHYYIDKNGTITQTASLDKHTNHVGKIKSKCKEAPTTCTPQELQAASAVQGIRNLHDHEALKNYPARYPTNQDSVGIEVVAEYDAATQTWTAPTAAQQTAITTLVEALKTEYTLTNADVYQHEEVSYKQPGEGGGLGY